MASDDDGKCDERVDYECLNEKASSDRGCILEKEHR
jgi:hypothetical protein